MVLMLCAAALCSAACKKDKEPGMGQGSAAPGSGAAPAGGSSGKIVIGVLTDMSGLYADLSGKGSVLAAQMAVDEMGGTVAGMPVEVISGDHQNKPDVGSSIAREWYDTKNVDVIVDVPTSSVALAVSDLTRDKNKVFLASGPGTSDLTGAKCSPNTVHWAYDTW
ncbi:MAG TPA: ABC transporter substrate-binding protein, partial [Kofleriaceae bacterium]|nr:ABC transporter substrate-binding protein [Kofleriaceae bacterium]